MQPSVAAVLVTQGSGVGRILESNRSISEHGAAHTLIKQCFVEMRSKSPLVIWGYVRFPSYAGIQCEPGIYLPGILKIRCPVILAGIGQVLITLEPGIRLTEHEIGQSSS